MTFLNRGFTARENSGVADFKRGTFAGIIEKIPYLVDLGITVVELLPIHQFDPQENNYWGYMTLNLWVSISTFQINPVPTINFYPKLRPAQGLLRRRNPPVR